MTHPDPSPATPSDTGASTRIDVEVFSDVACPWCFIGKRRFAAALEAFGGADRVRVTWRSYQLSPDAPRSADHPGRTEADMLVEMKGLDRTRVDAMLGQVTAVAAAEGLVYDFDSVVPANTFDAHRLVHVVAELGGPAAAEQVMEGLMSAHFERGLAVDDLDVLVDLARHSELDAAVVRAALDRGDGADGVRTDIAEARAIGVTGVPFFVLDRRFAVSGAQPVEVFTAALERAAASRSPA